MIVPPNLPTGTADEWRALIGLAVGAFGENRLRVVTREQVTPSMSAKITALQAVRSEEAWCHDNAGCGECLDVLHARVADARERGQ